MIKLVKKISRYIEYLRANGLAVSVHFTPDAIARLPYAVWEKLLPYNSHINPYCMAVKSCSADNCISHQRKIQSTKGDEPFELVCYAGVRERIFPISVADVTVGYAALSGYLGDAEKCPQNARPWLSSLVLAECPPDLADTLIPPLVIMLSNLFDATSKLEANEHNLISQYLAENHTTVTFDNFCRHFSRSRSYMSHKFTKLFGMSFSSYCNDLRLEDARRLLIVGEEPITDIALSCGFGDVSYFIRLFRSKYGVSPLKYRKSAQSST